MRREKGVANVAIAKAHIAKAETVILSERDSLRVLDLLERPPAPSERLRRAAKADFILTKAYFVLE